MSILHENRASFACRHAVQVIGDRDTNIGIPILKKNDYPIQTKKIRFAMPLALALRAEPEKIQTMTGDLKPCL